MSPALRKVAELLLVDPEAVAFGTVSSVAERAATSTPSVIRLATALGYSGFAELREAARAELSIRLRTDAVRVRAVPTDDPLTDLLEVEQANVADTLHGLDRDLVEDALALLDDEARKVWVLPSTQTAGLAARFVDQLMMVRDGVEFLDGSELRIMSRIGAVRRGDAIVSMDIARHELATVRAQAAAVERGAVPIVLAGALPVALVTDGGLLLPFASATVGPFDSLVGLTVLTTLLVNDLVRRRQPEAADRLSALERTWTTTGLFEA
ncbi:MAG: MurR/RpiR family transcriptional regulator [Acidimicrobiales bacterium]|nr:MurR/RpiR family transcriptional regulator [Acidimicrobiales bacterium]